MWSPDQAGQGQEDPLLAKHRAVAKLGDMQVQQRAEMGWQREMPMVPPVAGNCSKGLSMMEFYLKAGTARPMGASGLGWRPPPCWRLRASPLPATAL